MGANNMDKNNSELKHGQIKDNNSGRKREKSESCNRRYKSNYGYRGDGLGRIIETDSTRNPPKED